jgi:hypothetical protein
LIEVLKNPSGWRLSGYAFYLVLVHVTSGKKMQTLRLKEYIQEMLRCIGSLISGLQGSNAQVYDAVRQSKQILTWFDI